MLPRHKRLGSTTYARLAIKDYTLAFIFESSSASSPLQRKWRILWHKEENGRYLKRMFGMPFLVGQRYVTGSFSSSIPKLLTSRCSALG